MSCAATDRRSAISFAVCSLEAHHGSDPWILIGDLNIEPQMLYDKSLDVDIDLEDLISAPDRPTYIGGIGGTPSKFDYAINNIGATVTVIRTSARFHGSDQLPILIEW
jgi:hypothetical protein